MGTAMAMAMEAAMVLTEWHHICTSLLRWAMAMALPSCGHGSSQACDEMMPEFNMTLMSHSRDVVVAGGVKFVTE